MLASERKELSRSWMKSVRCADSILTECTFHVCQRVAHSIFPRVFRTNATVFITQFYVCRMLYLFLYFTLNSERTPNCQCKCTGKMIRENKLRLSMQFSTVRTKCKLNWARFHTHAHNSCNEILFQHYTHVLARMGYRQRHKLQHVYIFMTDSKSTGRIVWQL